MNDNDGTYRSGAQLLSEWGCKTREAKLARACAALMEQLNQKHKDHDGLDLSKHLTDERISCSCADAYRMGYEALNAPPDDGWRDIASAPKDQRSILGANERSGIQKVCWRSELNSDDYAYGCGQRTWKPTHWKALSYFRNKVPVDEPLSAPSPTSRAKGMRDETDFRWLIEAPGSRYLAVQRLAHSDNFEWTPDHNKALAFRSQEQADALMMAVRQMERELHNLRGNNYSLFGFEASLGNAKAVEHGWAS